MEDIERWRNIFTNGPRASNQEPCYKFILNVYGFGQHLDEKCLCKYMLFIFVDMIHTFHVRSYEI